MKQSRWERLRQEIRDKDAEIGRLRTELESTRAALESESKRRRELLDNLLKVEFEARVEKGCYSFCPRGRLKP